MSKRNYHEAVCQLITGLIDLNRAQDVLLDGVRFLYLNFSNCRAVYRWDEAEGFVYCGDYS